MKVGKTLFYFLAFFSFTVSFAQQVDLVRLGYSKNEIIAEQTGMAASPDGKFIAFAYSDKTVKIFDVVGGKVVKRFKGPYAEVFDFFITASGIVAIIQKKEVVLIDWKKEETVGTFALSDNATKAAYAGAIDVLAVGQQGGYVAMIDIGNKKLLHELRVKRHHVSGLAFHPDGKTIVVAVTSPINFNPAPLTLFDVQSGVQQAESIEKAYYTMATYNERGTEIMAVGMNMNASKRVMFTFDAQTLKTTRAYDSEINFNNTKVLYGGTILGGKLLGVTYGHSFNVYDAQTGGMQFTTESERGGLPSFLVWGVGSYNVFPLKNKSQKAILSASKNNINQIYDVATNSIVGYMFSDSNDDFAIVSRDGRVDGTEGALAKLHWTSRKSSRKTSLESTFEKGFTPRLLSEIISEKTTSVAFEIDDVVNKIPVISLKSFNDAPATNALNLQSAQKVSKLQIEVTEGLSEVTELKLYHNNKLVKTAVNIGSQVFTFDVMLNNSYGDQNYFYATASSKSGIDSEKLKFVVNYKGLTAERPNLFLVTIGINEYRNPKYNLNYAQSDADGVDETIKAGSASLFKNIFTYPIRNDKALKANIMNAFEQVKQKALEQDVLIVYYAGHGVMSEGTPEKPREFFLIPSDITQLYGRDDMLYEKAISADEIKSFTSTINAQKQVFILDACQSAGALETVATRGAMEEKAIAQMARSTGTFWITASGSEQFATEFAQLKHGVFTYALLEGLNGKADANADKKLTVRELSTYIEQKVPELSEQFKGVAQFPSAYSFGNDFPIVVYK
jgi:WD40 repeat protein